MTWCSFKKKHRDNFNFTFYHEDVVESGGIAPGILHEVMFNNALRVSRCLQAKAARWRGNTLHVELNISSSRTPTVSSGWTSCLLTSGRPATRRSHVIGYFFFFISSREQNLYPITCPPLHNVSCVPWRLFDVTVLLVITNPCVKRQRLFALCFV
jgi:hypothetical protein